MNGHLAALEAFVEEDEAWQGWLSLLIRPDQPVLTALRHSVRSGDDASLIRFAELLAAEEFADRLFNAFATHAEFGPGQLHEGSRPGSGIHVDRLHSLLQAAVAAARLAVRLQIANVGRTAEAIADVVSDYSGSPTYIDPEPVHLALGYLKDAGYGAAALIRWVLDFLRLDADTVDRVPLACVIDGCRGALASLFLSSWRSGPSVMNAIVPDLEAALTPLHDDLPAALAAVEPDSLTRLISWRIVCPSGLRANHVAGSSLQGAAAVGLNLIASGERFHSGILILAETRGGRLCPVGYEHLKLLAAVESYDRGRTSKYASDDQSCLTKILVSEASDCDMTPADARGMPWLRLATVEEAARVVTESNRVAEENVYQIARATRRIKAMPAPPEGQHVVETATGRVFFSPESRTDFISEVQLKDNNRLREPYVLHYRAQTAGSLVEADCHPIEDNLFFDDIGYANYEQLKKLYEFRFIPSPGAEYRLHARVFGGFGPGSRNMHCHFLDRAIYDVVVFELDLAALGSSESGFYVPGDANCAPKLSMWRALPPQFGAPNYNRKPEALPGMDRKRTTNVCDRFCSMAKTSDPIAPSLIGEQFWRWEIEKIRFGAVLWVDWEHSVVRR